MLKAEVAGIGFPKAGVPQGGIISPLLSNVVLNEFDWWIASQWEEIPTRHAYTRYQKPNGVWDHGSKFRFLRQTNLKECWSVRFADDFKIFARNYQDAVKLFHATKGWLKDRLGLDISPEKSKIVNLKESYSEFLGFKMRVIKRGKKPNAYAAYMLGRMCREGVGTPASKEQSDGWYRRAYNGFLSMEETMADDKLYYRLGQMNLSGTGTETDLEKAEFYFRKAADLNNIDALYGLGKLYLNKSYEDYDPQKATAYLIEAAKQDHEFAQYTLGKLFLKGEAVPKNISYALRWLEEAASKGNPYAEYLLGKTLLLGDDVDRVSDRGEALLKKSADNGNVYAAYTLGKALLDGDLLLQDVPKALRLITQAADGGFSSAQYLLGKLLYRGEVTAQDIPKALSYLGNASVQDHPYAAYLAGKILLTEESVKDVPKAIRCFEVASDAGNDFAEYQLGKLYLNGKEVSQDYERAMEYLSSSAAHGNQYAAQLLQSIQSNRNWSAALGTLRLFHHLSQMIQKRMEDDWKHKAGTIDRKLKRIIDEKKQAQGLK